MKKLNLSELRQVSGGNLGDLIDRAPTDFTISSEEFWRRLQAPRLIEIPEHPGMLL